MFPLEVHHWPETNKSQCLAHLGAWVEHGPLVRHALDGIRTVCVRQPCRVLESEEPAPVQHTVLAGRHCSVFVWLCSAALRLSPVQLLRLLAT